MCVLRPPGVAIHALLQPCRGGYWLSARTAGGVGARDCAAHGACGRPVRDGTARVVHCALWRLGFLRLICGIWRPVWDSAVGVSLFHISEDLALFPLRNSRRGTSHASCAITESGEARGTALTYTSCSGPPSRAPRAARHKFHTGRGWPADNSSVNRPQGKCSPSAGVHCRVCTEASQSAQDTHIPPPVAAWPSSGDACRGRGRGAHPSGSVRSGWASVLRTWVLRSSSESSLKSSRKYLSVSARKKVSWLSFLGEEAWLTFLMPT